MHQGTLVFAQIVAHLPLSTFRRCVAAHRGDHKVQEFSCLDQFVAMAFAQLTARKSLRDIEVNLRAQSARLYHLQVYLGNISCISFHCRMGMGRFFPVSPSPSPTYPCAHRLAHFSNISR